MRVAIRNSEGDVVGETTTGIASDGTVVVRNTLYDGGHVVAQHISVQKPNGEVKFIDVLGELLP